MGRTRRMSLYKAFRGLASGSARDAALLSTGSLVANLIGLIAVPVLSRLYSPSDFGLLALFMSVAAIARSVATGRYEMAVPLTRTQGAAF